MLKLNVPKIVEWTAGHRTPAEWDYDHNVYPTELPYSPACCNRNQLQLQAGLAKGDFDYVWWRFYMPSIGTCRISSRMFDSRPIGKPLVTSVPSETMADRIHSKPNLATFALATDGDYQRWTIHATRHHMILLPLAMYLYQHRWGSVERCPLMDALKSTWEWVNGVPIGPAGATFDMRYVRCYR